MRRVIIFGGTTEGRILCRTLSAWEIPITVCVATEYGYALLEDIADTVDVHTGRMDEGAMEAMLREGCLGVVDATHPYAVSVSANIRRAAARTGTPYLRLRREASRRDEEGTYAASLAEAVDFLKTEDGSILAATGVKELDAYTALENYASRVYPRVLPTEDSIRRCRALGFAASHIIAMQGPFSQALNEALIRQLSIRWLVTKDGGEAGGFMEKITAARQCGIGAVIIGRPPEAEGEDNAAILEKVRDWIKGGG